MRFVAVDVETARGASDSICQIGMCVFVDGGEVGTYETLVDPECGFDAMNIRIHGITPDRVVGAPAFGAVVGAVNACLRGSVIVSHSHFDRTALTGAYARIGRRMPECMWLDSIALAKRAWPDQAERGGYKLSALAARLGIAFRHHDALEDARTAGRIAIAALAEAGITLEQAVRAYGKPTGGGTAVAPPAARRGPPMGFGRPITLTEFAGGNGPLAGHRISFTGTLALAREEAARLASSFGAQCSDSISRRTTLLVIGDHRTGHDPVAGKSGKQVKVERLIAEGAAIRILSEAAFLALCERCRG